MNNSYSTFRQVFFFLAFFAILLLCSTQSFALIEVSAGNSPLRSHEAESFPLGVDKVTDLSSRLGYMIGPPFGGGLYTFEYECSDTEEFQKALNLFAAIRLRKLEVVIHDEICNSTFFKEQGETIWTLTIWQPEQWHRLYSNPTTSYRLEAQFYGKPVPAPQLDLYLGSNIVNWEEVNVPDNVTVIDKRIQSAKYKPEKGALIYGELNDMETGRPVAGAKVWIRQYDSEAKKYIDKEPSAQTNEMGEYKLEVIAPKGYYEICYSKKGYAIRTEDCSLSGQLQVEEFVPELVTEAWIDGLVVDSKGNPVPDVRVEVRELLGMDGRPYQRLGYNPIRPFGMTDSKGHFEIKSLPRGYTHLYAIKSNLHFDSTNVLYKIPTEFERKYEQGLEVKIIAEGTGSIHGKVVGIGEKARGRQVNINIESLDEGNTWGGSMNCKEDGGFAFEEVPPGRYKLSTQPMLPGVGDDPNAIIVIVSAGESHNVEVKYSTSRDLVHN